jgi:hypothetical protein
MLYIIELMLRPVPSSGLLHVVESPPSGSDYEAARDAKMKQRAFYRRRGKSVSDTEEEELEEDARLERELVEERVGKRGQSLPRYTAEEKGKGKAKSGQVEEDVVNEDDEDEDEEANRNMHGPLSKAGMAEAVELGNQTRKSAELIAKKYGKTVRNVMISAGLGIQNARQDNFSNLFKVWYAHHHPSQEGG